MLDEHVAELVGCRCLRTRLVILECLEHVFANHQRYLLTSAADGSHPTFAVHVI